LQTRGIYYQGLDGLRAIAVTFVILIHYLGFKIGWIGVDLFFVLSGFLIASILDRDQVDTLAGYGSFLGRRARRILPAYFVCVGLTLLVAQTFWPQSHVIKSQVHLWLMTSDYYAGFVSRGAFSDAYVKLAHLWSLAVEIHFYILFPAVVMLAGSIKRAAIILIAVAVATRILLFSFGASDNAVYAFTLCRLDTFGFGALAYLASGELKQRQLGGASIAVGLASLGALCAVLWTSEGWFKLLPWLQLWGYSAIAISAALLVAGIVVASPTNVLIRMLESAPMRLIGRASYSIYLWHYPFYPLVHREVTKIVEGPEWLVRLAICAGGIVVTGLLATLSFLLVERVTLSRRQKLARA